MNILYRILSPHSLNNEESYQPIIELKQNLSHLQIKHFMEIDIHGWQWWVNLIFTIIPLLIWLKFVDRKRLLEITAYGFLVLTMVVFLDVSGASFALWDYPNKLLPFLPMVPIDFVVVPIIFMFIYQICSSWKSYSICVVLIALLYSFAAEPILVKYSFYALINWNYLYSFPIYVIIAISARGLVRILISRQI